MLTIDDPEAPEALRRELLALIGVLRTNVLTFEEFVAPFSRFLDESARSCRLKGQCPAIGYMDNSFRRFLGKLRRDHDWVVLSSEPPEANGRQRLNGLSPLGSAPRPGGGRVGFISIEGCEAQFGKILGRSDDKCEYRGDCPALRGTRSKIREFLGHLQDGYGLVLLKSDGDPWTSDERLGRLETVHANVVTRRQSPSRLRSPATPLIRLRTRPSATRS